MNVFAVQFVRPSSDKASQKKHRQELWCSPADATFLAGDRFRGHLFPDDWHRVELNFGDSEPWTADFHSFGPGALVCSERAKDTACALEDEGEFLPVKIRGVRGRYHLFNTMNCRSYLNSKKTVWKKSRKISSANQIVKHSFWADRIGDDCLFKLLEEGAVTHYCIERTGDPHDGEFKALIESAGLTGVAFKKVWSGGR